MNQLKIGNKRSVTLRLDTYDYKCIQLLAHQRNVTVSNEIAMIIASVTSQTKTIFTEEQLDGILQQQGIKDSEN